MNEKKDPGIPIFVADESPVQEQKRQQPPETPKTISSLDGIGDIADLKYAVVVIHESGQQFRLASLDADTMIEWTEGHETPAQKRIAGLRLIALSLVDDAGVRYGIEWVNGQPNTDKAVAHLGKKSTALNNRLVKAIMALNDMGKVRETASKNDSSEADTVASPTVLH